MLTKRNTSAVTKEGDFIAITAYNALTTRSIAGTDASEIRRTVTVRFTFAIVCIELETISTISIG